jgi:hypothetical protein
MNLNLEVIMTQDVRKSSAIKQKVWQGNQEACELCNTPFTQIEWFADAHCKFMTRFGTRHKWAIVCPKCHAKHTNGKFGLGIGQKYDSITKIKIEG